jgi:hypothetical protein
MACKNCGEPIVQTPGKRAKEFCDSTCRSNYWQIKNRLGKIGLSPPKPQPNKPTKKAKAAPKVVPKKEPTKTGKPEPRPGSMNYFLKYGNFGPEDNK